MELNAPIGTIISLSAGTAILIAGVADDLRSRMFHNWLFLVCSFFALVAVLLSQGVPGLYFGMIGFAAAFALLFPLVVLGVLGAGDMKLLAAFGIATGWESVLAVTAFSLVWGAIFGLVKVLVSGQGRVLALNMVSIVSLKKRETLELHRIPYSVALLMGWLSHVAYRGVL